MFQPFVLRNKSTGKKQVIRTAPNYARDKATSELHRMFNTLSVTNTPFDNKGVSNFEVTTRSGRRHQFELISV